MTLGYPDGPNLITGVLKSGESSLATIRGGVSQRALELPALKMKERIQEPGVQAAWGPEPQETDSRGSPEGSTAGGPRLQPSEALGTSDLQNCKSVEAPALWQFGTAVT